MELYTKYLIGYLVILFSIYIFNVIGEAVLGPESVRKASSEGLLLMLKMGFPLLLVLIFAYLINLSL
ncbi:hypothetical protein YDYSY3_38470 [Paenibacillus chitinolyticus]|uniref:hypothetical protein n=1 Tax=Paenibacillus chitinolyticus TaxID=79263 RepID=UPI0026E4A5D0|nr:hypothetical protein [Paenibacillus chitinolyticus]GKS12847.1 hypothetical protein YDYSY3_38470 [Paenibacillus chitinolyticus]